MGSLGYSAIQKHPCFHVTGTGMKQAWRVRYTCIHVQMHLHILTKVWDQKRDDSHTVSHRATQFFHVTVQRGWSIHGESAGHAYMY